MADDPLAASASWNPSSGDPRDERRTFQAAAFDAIGDRYDEAFPHKDGQVAAVARLVSALPPGARVLDVGSGTGLPTARQLVDAGHRVVGIDLSERMVAAARANVPEAAFSQGDILDVSAQDGPYDAVVAFFSLLMLPRLDIAAALGRIRGLLAPHGRLVLGMVEADVDDVAIPFIGTLIRVTGYLRDDLVDVVTAAGFEVTALDATSYAPTSEGPPPEVQLFVQARRAEE